MRVLFVTPYVPSRIRVRPFHLIKSLSSMHEISLVSLLCDPYERELGKEVTDYCASIDYVRLPKWQAYANCVRALPTLVPLRVAYYQSPAFSQRILQVIRERHIDVVHGELIKVVPALRAVLVREHIPILYDSVDAISSYLFQQWSSATNLFQKGFIYTELKKMRRYERQSLSAFDQVIITSPYDRDYLAQLGVAPYIQVIPNGVDSEFFTPPIVPREADSLVFCAKLDYYPNSQAILNFCDKMLPLIWKHRPQVRLTIVGNNPPEAVRKLSVDERITVSGYVPDIRSYLGKASVVVVPLLMAAGIQNKVLEALAMGAPIVATPVACRALNAEHGEHLLIAEEADAYAQSVLRLLEDAQLASNLSQAGRQLVERYYRWPEIAYELTALYSMVIKSAASKQEQIAGIVGAF